MKKNRQMLKAIIFIIVSAIFLIPFGKTGKVFSLSRDSVISNVKVIVNPSTPGSVAQYNITFNISKPMNSDDRFRIQAFTVGLPAPQPSDLIGHITVNGMNVNVTWIGSNSSNGGVNLNFDIILTEAIPAGPVTIFINSSAKIKNPASGTYQLRISASIGGSSTESVLSQPYSIGEGSVSNVNVTVNPPMVNTAARYTITFRTSSGGALTAGTDTISVEFPAGTTLPASIAPSYIRVQGTSCTVTPEITQSSHTVTITVPVNILGGANVTVVISELAKIKNPATASNYEIILWTSKDVIHKSSNYYTISASSVTKPSVSVDPTTVGSTATYKIAFNVSSKGSLVENNDTITFTFPTSTIVPVTLNPSYVKVNNVICSNVKRGSGTNQIVVTVPVYISGGTMVTVVFSKSFGIKNPSKTGTYTLKVHTSKDPADVESSSYTISSSKLSNVSVIAVPNMENLQASYIIQFNTGAAGALSAGDTITVQFPSGTHLPMSVPSGYISVNGSSPSSVVVYSGSSTVVITLPSNISILPFQKVVVTIQKSAGIKNPHKGSYFVKVKTSKEPDFVSSAKYSIIGLPEVNISVVPTSPNGKNGYYTVKPKVTLKLSENSGQSTVSVYYRIDNGDFSVYTSPILIEEGKHTLECFCKDSMGNKSNIKTKTFLVDLTPPSLAITSPSDGTIVYSNSVTVSGLVKDATLLQINGQNVQFANNGLFTYTVNLNTQGANHINILAFDDAGNKVAKTITVNYIKRVTVIMQIGNNFVYVNGAQRKLSYPPFIYKGRTMVPLRFLSEVFNAQIDWDPIFKIVTVFLGGKKIRVQVGNTVYDNNGKIATLDAPPIIKNGHTFVPLRLIIEAFGGSVTWDPKMQVINIVYPKG